MLEISVTYCLTRTALVFISRNLVTPCECYDILRHSVLSVTYSNMCFKPEQRCSGSCIVSAIFALSSTNCSVNDSLTEGSTNKTTLLPCWSPLASICMLANYLINTGQYKMWWCGPYSWIPPPAKRCWWYITSGMMFECCSAFAFLCVYWSCWFPVYSEYWVLHI